MPRINYTPEVAARTGRTNTPMIASNATGEAYGAGIGRAVQGIGDALAGAGSDLNKLAIQERERKRQEDLANNVANSDFTPKELQLRNEVDVNATDYRDRVSTEYDNWVEENADKIDDDVVRSNYRTSMLSRKDDILARSAQYEAKTRADTSKDEANNSINTLQNRIAQDPSFYDDGVKQGYDVIDARPDLTASMKAGMKTEWKYDAAQRRFNGRLASARTPEDIDAIAGELTNLDKKGRDWQAEFRPEDYERVTNTLGTMRKAFATQIDTSARAALTSLEEREKSSTKLIGADELKAAQETAARSDDPVIRERMARIVRNQDIIRTDQRLPPAELRARINAANGNPGVAYPNLPPRVSNAVNKASNVFGIPASYLGGMANKEYGQFFAKGKPQGDQKFKPLVAHKDVDLRNMRSDVVDAVTLAGQAFGAPLTVTSGTKSSTGIDISTVGMAPKDKARVAGALVDAGFTGIAEYDNRMHVDMRDAVPQQFNEKYGKVWGGWTYLTPEVSAVLKEKGFAAGASSATIKRKAPAQSPDAVDYGKPTQIVGANGKPTSSAVGIAQFTEGTWLSTIKENAAMLGVDVAGKTDAQILELRKDPDVSIMAAAAYAYQNKKTLEETLGRPINEAEMYMAHFMGAGGAVSFLNAYKNNPDQTAAILMPESAKANPSVFYTGGDRSRPRTVREVYSSISNGFNIEPTRVAFEDNQVRSRILQQAETALKNDPISHATSVGSHVIIPLDQENGFSSRGATSRAVADYYGLSMKDMKPFTEDEAMSIKKQIDEGNADTSLNVMAQIQSMGTEPAKAAMKQLEQKDKVFAHAGDLYLEGQPGVAGDIIRGRQRMVDNPEIANQIGATPQELNDAFVKAVGPALSQVRPEYRQSIQDSALAYYVQHAAGRDGMSKFNQTSFSVAVQRVLGGSDNAPAIGDVNGHQTLLPKGITADAMENAIDNMQAADWARMSVDGKPPKYADGTLVDPMDIRNDLRLQAMGGGRYLVALDDDTLLTTGDTNSSGRAVAYVFVPDAKRIRELSAMPKTASAQGTAGYPGFYK